MLNSVLGIEDGLVPDLLIFSVKNIVLVLVSDFFLISVESLRVLSLEIFNVGIVPVLFFISVEDFVVSFVGGEWDIIPLGLSVVSEHCSWLPGESRVVIWPVVDLIGFSLSDLLLWLVLDLNLFVLSGDWDLLGSNFLINSSFDGVVDFLIKDLNIVVDGL